MSEHDSHNPHTGGPGYETSDADVRAIFKSGVVMFAFIFMSIGLMWTMHDFFKKTPMPMDREPTAMEMERMLPPTPRLQVNQAGDLKEFREREQHRLSSYGWVNKQAGVVHIPIDKAIELVAEKGLPQPVAAKPAAAPKK